MKRDTYETTAFSSQARLQSGAGGTRKKSDAEVADYRERRKARGKVGRNTASEPLL
jgi:hypothetical protein